LSLPLVRALKPEAPTDEVTHTKMNSACCLAAVLVASTLLLEGCSRSPEPQDAAAADQADDPEAPEIERYRTVLEAVAASQQALALETARINDGNWSAVAERSLRHANELQTRIERLMEFEEAVSAAAALKLHVASLQRQLRGIDAETWQGVLPDLLLTNESIQSDMDELTDLAAPVTSDSPVYDHDLAGA
jgi:hypothetical protein